MGGGALVRPGIGKWGVNIRRQYQREPIANVVVYPYLAYSCALKYMVAEFIRAAAACAEGLVGGVIEDR